MLTHADLTETHPFVRLQAGGTLLRKKFAYIPDGMGRSATRR